MEIRDDENFHEAVLHFFNEGGEYLQSVNGNISKGRWRLMGNSNKIIIESDLLYHFKDLKNALQNPLNFPSNNPVCMQYILMTDASFSARGDAIMIEYDHPAEIHF